MVVIKYVFYTQLELGLHSATKGVVFHEWYGRMKVVFENHQFTSFKYIFKVILPEHIRYMAQIYIVQKSLGPLWSSSKP